MKIKELHISGYRSLKNVTWQPGDLNIVIGPNGSGKSNLLRMLEMISAAASGNLSKFIVEQGGMDPIVWDGSHDHVGFELRALHSLPESSHDLVYQLIMTRLGKSSTYRIEFEDLLSLEIEYEDPLSLEKNYNNIPLIKRTPTEAIYTDDNDVERPLSLEQLTGEASLLSFFSGPFAASVLIKAFKKDMELLSIYHDVNVSQDSRIRQANVTKHETRLSPDGQNLVSVLHTLYTGNRTFKDDVNAAMTAAFGDDFEELTFPPDADGRVQMRVRWKTLQREQSAAGLSDGTLRFLFLIAALANPSPPALIAIDEPETGLHPGMLPIVAEFAVSASRKSQVVFTTHSPEFLNAFEDTKPTTTVATWENGETKLSTIDGETLEYWLKHYTLGKLFVSGELEILA